MTGARGKAELGQHRTSGNATCAPIDLDAMNALKPKRPVYVDLILAAVVFFAIGTVLAFVITVLS
jgi:hypothetical protein